MSYFPEAAVTFNPKEEYHEPRWYLWNERYLCKVPYIQSRSAEDIKMFGMPTSGYEEHDHATAHEPVHRMLAPIEMLELWQQGAQVAVVNREDTKRIYERFLAHLTAWKRELDSGFHLRSAPIDDLKVMDQFANVVYEHAKYHFTDEYVDSLFAKRIRGSVTVNRESVLIKPIAVTINGDGTTSEEERKFPARSSFAEVLASRELAGKAKWK